MNLDHDFFQESKFSEHQKNTVNSKFSEHQNPPNNFSMQTIGLLKLLGGIQSNYWGIYFPIPPPPSGFGTPVGEKMKRRQTNVEKTDLRETIIRVKAQNKA